MFRSYKSAMISETEYPQTKTYMTIDKIVQKFPQLPQQWVLKAKIIKKPFSINPNKPFMIIRLLDENMKSIEGIFFGKQAQNYCHTLQPNHSYLFSNGLIKLKKNSHQFEIKFHQHSQIIASEAKRNSKEFKENEMIAQHISKQKEGQTFSITVRVMKVRNMSKGRTIQALDINNDSVEIILWSQFQDQIQQSLSYQFKNLRLKYYNQSPSLQSVRYKTEVKKVQDFSQELTSTVKKEHIKPSFNPKQIKQIKQIVQNVPLDKKTYANVFGYLTIQNETFINKYFQIQCTQCGSKDAKIDPISCKSCDKEIMVRWNVRAVLMDEKQQIKCILNEQFCQRVFKLTSKQAFILYNESIDDFMMIVSQNCFRQGIFKVKINPYKSKVYYNILQLHKEDSLVLLQHSKNKLRKTMKEFIIKNSQ